MHNDSSGTLAGEGPSNQLACQWQIAGKREQKRAVIKRGSQNNYLHPVGDPIDFSHRYPQSGCKLPRQLPL